MPATIEDVAGKSFDFVIIGGGTAGLVVANRLTENDSVTVLVLEAGAANDGDPALLSPATFGSQFGNPQYEWGYTTVPQPRSNNRSIAWPRGKGLGGSSGINFFQYHLPAKADIDAFEELGNPGWNWDLIKKYQMKSECFIPPSVKEEPMSYDLSEHGKEGPLVTAYPVTQSGLEKPYHQTLAILGVQRAKDPLSGDHTGTWLSPMTIHPKAHVRTYAANAYYTPVADRQNLIVLTSARVAKIESTVDSKGVLTATGVKFIYDGTTHSVLAEREVVLSAGTLINPQILELSGIGNREILQTFNIETKLNIPGVGSNIQDHIHTISTFEIREERQNEVLTFDCLRDPTVLRKEMELFVTGGKGVFGMGLSMMSFIPLDKISRNSEAIYADLEKDLKRGILETRYSELYQEQFRLQLQRVKNGQANCETVLAQGAAPIPNIAQPGKKYISFLSLLNNPFSRGTIHIKSTDPLEFPSMDPHYFEENYDLQLLVEIFKFNRHVVQTEPLKSYVKPVDVFPGPQVETDEQIAGESRVVQTVVGTLLRALPDYIRNTIGTVYHTVGSCSMLPLSHGGVVDTRLKIHGTTNIRVVDISIIPLQVGAHTQALAFSIGEIGADIIKGKLVLP